jgi:hypothetical protein
VNDVKNSGEQHDKDGQESGRASALVAKNRNKNQKNKRGG